MQILTEAKQKIHTEACIKNLENAKKLIKFYYIVFYDVAGLKYIHFIQFFKLSAVENTIIIYKNTHSLQQHA